MSDVLDRIEALRAEALTAIEGAADTAALEDLRVRVLGRKAELPNILRGVAELPPEQRGAVGKAANVARKAVEARLEERVAELAAGELDARLVADAVDLTLPGAPPRPVGRLHLLTQTRRQIEDVFLGLGFRVAEGPEVEWVHYNFDALNHVPAHPARSRSDTFYVQPPDGGPGPGLGSPDEIVLRTHTSPMQVRSMEAQKPPIAVIVPGRVYRRDSDATHTPQFHQVEGLWVDEDVTLADLKGVLLAFARALFGDEREVRLRPHFFPFTEPSVEVDVTCFQCSGTGALPRTGARCNLCKGTGWLEILGSGMVDPNVLGGVDGYEDLQGFAFGMGIERIAMLKHGVPDLRLYYENDLRFLEQFG
ncbi:phenylalanine--tRNA ligase subunit alpha [Paraconexibacter algicola]|uniref:Phenylalanine--tRNA ligase alpha subunit n=1 Tax=Paraconexibacter algicola TaxID=2133960 RepID=A0A2T4UB68_9ACTN|nr:phenylalanine--tRNA ligase subunit alpha [Paraconexibacter algicola]PTL54111.1 phenylalanine--tRNA ligase subunit alpha [Paraconexibacter algicola]